MLAGALVSCASDGPDNGPGKGKNMVLKSANIKDSKCLFVQGSADTRAEETTYEHGLFKIDEDGNISSVMITYVYNDKTGTTTETRSDMHVYPEAIYEVGDDYLYFAFCDYYWDGLQSFVYDERNYDKVPGWLMKKLGYSQHDLQDLLVRKSDGNIYTLEGEIGGNPIYWYFNPFEDHGHSKMQGYSTYGYTAKNGLSYLLCNKLTSIFKIAVNNGTTQLEQVNPNNFEFPIDPCYFVAGNGTILLTNDMGWNQSTTLLYSNGGFNIIENDVYEEGNRFFPYSEGVMHIKSIYSNEWFEAYLYQFDPGTVANSYSDVKELASIQLIPGWGDQNAFFEASTRFFIANIFYLDKDDMNTPHFLTDEQQKHLAYKEDQFVYGNKVYTLDSSRINWFDLETLEFGEITDALSTFKPQSHSFNPQTGEISFTGLSYATGYAVVCTLDLNTGKYKITETPSSRPVTSLVQLS